ncbi:hypothetical protein [Burkholderia glumae]|uniref:hypothetical protein n=1 Tax=Burkholderia glumae TaxID=337 RepID=UPI0021513524|nr:hypothetical protein [Burkholderia glumae]
MSKIKNAYELSYEIGFACGSCWECPFEILTPKYLAWMNGYREGFIFSVGGEA